MSKEDEKSATRSSMTNSGISERVLPNIQSTKNSEHQIIIQNINSGKMDGNSSQNITVTSSTPQNFEEKLTEGNIRFGMLFNYLPGTLNFVPLKNSRNNP